MPKIRIIYNHVDHPILQIRDHPRKPLALDPQLLANDLESPHLRRPHLRPHLILQTRLPSRLERDPPSPPFQHKGGTTNQRLPGVLAIYFISPTRESIEAMLRDLQRGYFDQVQISFNSMIQREDWGWFIEQCKLRKCSQVVKVGVTRRFSKTLCLRCPSRIILWCFLGRNESNRLLFW